MSSDSTQTSVLILEQILASVHPQMAEALYLAAIPNWYDIPLFSALRNREDGRNAGVVDRLTRYSFINPLNATDAASPTYMVQPEERAILQRHWITTEPDAYRSAHKRALRYWEAHPDANTYAQTQNKLYHLLFVDQAAAKEFLIDRFRDYHHDRQLAAIDRLLRTVKEALFYLRMLGDESIRELDDLNTHLSSSLAQLRGQWAESRTILYQLRERDDLSPDLRSYVVRDYGDALARAGDYVEAIAEFDEALKLFQQQANAAPGNRQAHRGIGRTLIARGDAHVGLAIAARAYEKQPDNSPEGSRFLDFLNIIAAAPLLIYLSFYLGRRVWSPEFWPTVLGLDWLIARMFAIGAKHYREADIILETYGSEAEGVAAEERLAYLYLAMGDAQQAQVLLETLYADDTLGEYRRAAVASGLGEALLKRKRPFQALPFFSDSLPLLHAYEDWPLAARTRSLLGETLYVTGDKEGGLLQFTSAISRYEQLEEWVRATDVAEILQALVQNDPAVSTEFRQEATAVAESLSHRRYPVRFRHNAIIVYQRVSILVLAFLLMIVPLLTIKLDMGTSLNPEITFRAAPILSPDQTVSSQISQGVASANIAPASTANVLFLLGGGLLLGYIFIPLILGMLLIALTPLRTIQSQAKAAMIRLDGNGITSGQGDFGPDQQITIKWTDIGQLVKADTWLWRIFLSGNSAFGVASTERQIIIAGPTSWYHSLRRRIEQQLPAARQQIDKDFDLLRSPSGILYLANSAVIAMLYLLAEFAQPALWRDLAGLPYSLADLYPYLFIGLFAAPSWLGILRPLQIRRLLKPTSLMPWALFASGVGLLILLMLLRFRPLLSVANIYPALMTMTLAAGGGIAIWRANSVGQRSYRNRTRWLTLGAAGLISLFMVILLAREVSTYHFLVLGNNWRDRGFASGDPTEKASFYETAVIRYQQAIDNSQRRVLGIDSWTAAWIPFGIPDPHNFSWLSAYTSQAALRVQLAQNSAAIESYNEILRYTDKKARIYSWRAVVWENLGTSNSGNDSMKTADSLYDRAINDFHEAIALEPENASFYLWRGVAYHTLDNQADNLELALADYRKALDIPGSLALTPENQERALSGIGWIQYGRSQYERALASFQAATTTNPEEAEAWIGLGYSYYALGDFAKAEQVWSDEALPRQPENPVISISLGTLYWRLARDEASDDVRCWLYQQAYDYLENSVTLPGQNQSNLAFTYRTLGQISFLLPVCADQSRLDYYQRGYENYVQAVELEPANAVYQQMTGRFSYAIWDLLPKTADFRNDRLIWLDRAKTRLTQSAVRGLNDNTTRDFQQLTAAAYLQEAEAALQANQPQDAVQFFRAGLDAARASGDYTTMGTAVQTMWQSAYRLNPAIQAVQQETIATIAAAAGPDARSSDGPTSAAVQMGHIALMIEDDPRAAAAWYNAAIRIAVTTDTSPFGSQYRLMRNSRDQWYTWWAAGNKVNSRQLITHLNAQLAPVLSRYPELENNDTYWAYRAWFKYGAAMASLRVGAETAAQTLLADAQRDANRSNNSYALTYMPEAAWGWFHILRGDTSFAKGAYAAALADYETAVAAITPQDNSDAFLDITEAAVKAGNTAIRLNEYEKAGRYYITALRWVALAPDVGGPAEKLRSVRSELFSWWGEQGTVQAGLLLDAIETAQTEQLSTYPQLADNSNYWRYSGWLKYDLGFSALRLGEESQARQALAVAYADGQRSDNDYIGTYLGEGAWGWYHLIRGDDYFAAGDLELALADYETAVAAYQPDANQDARNEMVTAAFKAARTAFYLNELATAQQWYERGLALTTTYQPAATVLAEAHSILKVLLLQNDVADPDLWDNVLQQLDSARQKIE